MTAKETERLAKVEQKVDDAGEDITEIKSDVKTILKKFEDLDDRYPTRREIAAIKTIVGILLAAVSALAAILALKN
jgi:hypothetical protein